jgi:hypothetical protein
MIEENEFYISLSNVKMDKKYLKGDQQLPKSFNLYTHWKVGLTELHINSQFENFHFKEDLNFFMKTTDSQNWLQSSFTPAGIDNIETLIEFINYRCESLPGIFQDILKIEYDDTSKIIDFKLKDNCEIILSDLVNICLGAGRARIISKSFSMRYKGKYFFESPAFILNCNLVEQNVVNNIYEPYLKMFDLNENWSASNYRNNYVDVHYIKIKEKTFGILKFELKQIRGFPVKFTNCAISCNLHFIRNE